MDKKIVIVGAGYAGILVAKKLAKRFKRDGGVSVTIIDKNPFHTMLTELHEVVAGRVDEDSIKINLKRVFAGRRVDVIQDLIDDFDFEAHKIIGKKDTYDYDYLVLAAGSQPTFFGVSGAEKNARKMWSYQNAVDLRDHVINCFRKAAVITDEDEKKKLLTFYVVGAGFTGVEMAGELAEYIPVLCEKYEVDKDLVSVCDVDILKRTVPNLPEKLSRKVEKRLAKMNVDVMLDTHVTAVGEDFIETMKDDVTVRTPTNTVIWAAGVESCDLTSQAACELESAGRGRIKVDAYLRTEDKKDVYVIGDNMFYIPEGQTLPTSQTVENCEHSAKVATKNIEIAIRGTGEMEAYKPNYHGMMVCIGGRYGVAYAGLSNHMISWASFFAMFIKHIINIFYFIQVLGYNKIISYMKHEFFTIRNHRSFVGGHFSNVTPSFLLVPLRIWLGAVWVFEGIMKIVEGWMEEPMLTEFFGGADAWFNSILNPAAADGSSGATGAAAEAATDAVSAATGAGAGGGEVVASVGTSIFNFDFLGLFSAALVSGKDLAESSLNDLAFKLDVPLMDWFMEKTILANDSFQVFMQIVIVIVEILIGLALVGGLFTSPAALVSLVLQFMFLCTTGLYLGTFWMVFAGIAMLIGAGRTFGLDYYFMPLLKKKWKKIGIIRKSYLYND